MGRVYRVQWFLLVLRMRCPDELIQLLHSHYDKYKAENSGPWKCGVGHTQKSLFLSERACFDFNPCAFCLKKWFHVLFLHPLPTSLPAGVPHDVLQMEFFVPGSTTRRENERYRGKPLFAEILTVKPETTMTYFLRLVQDTPTEFRWVRVETIVMYRQYGQLGMCQNLVSVLAPQMLL